MSTTKRSFAYGDLDDLSKVVRSYLDERTSPVGQTLPAELFADAREWARRQGVDLPGDPKLSAAFVAAGAVRRRSNGKRLFEVTLR